MERQFNAWKIIGAAQEAGIVDQRGADRLHSLVGFLEEIRRNGLEEAAALCAEEAEKFHRKYREAVRDGVSTEVYEIGCHIAESMKNRIRGLYGGSHGSGHTQTQGSDPGAPGEGAASGTAQERQAGAAASAQERQG